MSRYFTKNIGDNHRFTRVMLRKSLDISFSVKETSRKEREVRKVLLFHLSQSTRSTLSAQSSFLYLFSTWRTLRTLRAILFQQPFPEYQLKVYKVKSS